jgi:hypothetical protein
MTSVLFGERSEARGFPRQIFRKLHDFSDAQNGDGKSARLSRPSGFKQFCRDLG